MNSNKNTNRQKYILLSCGVLFVIACLCLGIVLLAGVGASVIWPIDISNGSTQTPISTPVSELPNDLAKTLAEIESQVIQVRGLDKTQSVAYTLITADELEKMVVDDFFSEYSDEDAQKDALVLSSLGLLPKDFDLKGFYEALYSEQIAGFYDEETKEIYVVQGQDFGGSEKLTYAHEFTHVLQDQVYGLEQGLGLNEEACQEDSERCAAVQALIEGDATQTEILWFESYASMKDYRDLMEMFDHLESPVLDSAPAYMAADMYFPYENGFAFVQYLYEQGAYDAVDAAFAEPPVSTEQILHPEKYPNDVPLEVTLPDLTESLGDSWTLFDENVMGELYIYFILNKAYNEEHQLLDSLALAAAEGWGGDAYAVYINENTDEMIFIMDSLWDTSEDAQEFGDAFAQYAFKRWEPLSLSILDAEVWQGEEGSVGFWVEGSRSLWVIAPDKILLETIFSEIR
jgi:hypothetical protein